MLAVAARLGNKWPPFMPTYEYACSKCGKTFEIFQSMKDAPLMTCPEAKCQMTPWGQGPVKRLLGTGAGIIFKGSGFYSTDYRSEGYKQAAKKDSGGSAESKPAEKTSTTPAPAAGASAPASPATSGGAKRD